jgi:hypothetical protein
VAANELAPGRAPWRVPRSVHPSPAALRCYSKFLRFFPEGFRDSVYVERERGYKWAAHEQWESALGAAAFRRMLDEARYTEIAALAMNIESPTNLLVPFERNALREAITTPAAAKAFATGLYDYLEGNPEAGRFEQWVEALGSLPRTQTRVLTWPLVTVFGFLGRPDAHMFLKPSITRIGARQYGFELRYQSQPNWETYTRLLELAGVIRRDLRDLSPKDMIDIQSFIRVQGSDEYEE